ncbi:MAG: hypothetical protein K8J31_21305, partial [Anaerolineae bacterium]|nr:hypothetical protein [Anaerolineae bacterium]
VPAPTPVMPVQPPPAVEAGLCAATISAPRGANLRQSPMGGESITIVPFEAVVTVLAVTTIPGSALRWAKLNYEGQEGWTREDLLSFSGDCARFNLRVTSTTPAQPARYAEYSSAALYPVPMVGYRFIRGFTGPQPNHPGVDYGGDVGEPMHAGPVGGLLVASKECIRCNVPDKPSTVLQGFDLGDERIFSDEGWNFGFGHYMVVRYLHTQLPTGTRQTLANLGMPGAHIYAMYAHLSRRDVPVGTLLEPHQVFAACGNSGNSSGSHVHLELRASTNPSFPGWAAMSSGLVDPLIMFER